MCSVPPLGSSFIHFTLLLEAATENKSQFYWYPGWYNSWRWYLRGQLRLNTMTIAVQLSLQQRSRTASLTRRRLTAVTGSPSCRCSIQFFVIKTTSSLSKIEKHYQTIVEKQLVDASDPYKVRVKKNNKKTILVGRGVNC